MPKTLLHNIVIPGTPEVSGVLFDENEILETGNNIDLQKADIVIDGSGNMLMPGVIDTHVHFREPGMTPKGDMDSESRAAKAGGVTTVFEMPNTKPPTTTQEAWNEKMQLAENNMAVNYAFFIGLTNDNLDFILKADYSRIPGVKVFMGSSTGNMLVTDMEVLDELFARTKIPVVIHAEDEAIIQANLKAVCDCFDDEPPVNKHTDVRSAEACIKSTSTALELLARNPKAHLHIAHLSTAAEVEMIKQAKESGLHVTCEVSPHHLLFTKDDYDKYGSRIKINPAVKTVHDREKLREAVIDGTIDIIATDHAPHRLEDKRGGILTAASGAPMVQFVLPVVMDLFGAETARRTLSENPAKIFGVEKRGYIKAGYRPEMALVQPVPQGYEVTDSDVISKCGWTPLNGHILHHKVVQTFLPKPQAIRFLR